MADEERKTSVAALKARFSGGNAGNRDNNNIVSNKSDLIKNEITTGRRMSVKDMANKFKDPSSINEEQRRESG